jgi:hypothetical protein
LASFACPLVFKFELSTFCWYAKFGMCSITYYQTSRQLRRRRLFCNFLSLPFIKIITSVFCSFHHLSWPCVRLPDIRHKKTTPKKDALKRPDNIKSLRSKRLYWRASILPYQTASQADETRRVQNHQVNSPVFSIDYISNSVRMKRQTCDNKSQHKFEGVSGYRAVGFSLQQPWLKSTILKNKWQRH